MSAKRGTYLIEFSDGSEVIFGNNYKAWWEHAREYVYRFMGDRAAIEEHGWHYGAVVGVVVTVRYSNQQFYDDGGLKWCELNAYQGVINDVCRQDKLAPVDARAIVFTPAPNELAVLTKKLKEY